MVFTGTTALPIAGATENIREEDEEMKRIEREKAKCAANGGTWDEENQVCILPKKEEVTPPKVDALGVEGFKSSETGRPSGVTLPDGRTFLGLGPEDVAKIQAGEQAKQFPEGVSPVGTAQAQSDVQFRGEQLSNQIGVFQELGLNQEGLFDYGEAATTGVVGAIPRALGLAATGAAVGAAGGTAVLPGIGTAGGAAVGAAAGFVSGLASSMISNMKSQRSDTTTAQQRVLDEGKQTMKDWATLAASDPSNKAQYLAEYNKVSAQINQAYRQMKLDTSRDIGKFETALPNLAEFEAFYSEGGERDTLDIEMRTSLITPSPVGSNIVELSYRRRKDE